MSMSSETNRRVRTKKPAVVVAVLGMAALAAFGVTLSNVLRYAGASEPMPTDALLVLGAAVWPGERPSPILRSRVEAAVDLYHQGYAKQMIVSGGLGRYPPSEAEVMRRVAVAAGVPEEAIILEEASHSTLDNIENSAEIMRARGWTSVAVVSDPFHMYRICRMAEDAGLEAHPAPAADSPGWTIPRLRAYYTVREVLAVFAYEVQRLWRAL